MKPNSGLILSLLASAALIALGCRRVDNVVWSKYVDIPSEGWDPVNVIPFFPWPGDSLTDSSFRYDMVLSVRFSPMKIPSPLHVVVRQENDEGMERNDTVIMEMQLPPNTPTGRGAYGIYEMTDTVLRDISLTPGYCVELQSLSEKENSAGIIDLGLILSQH